MKNKKNIIFAAVGAVFLVIGIVITALCFLPSCVNISGANSGIVNYSIYENNIRDEITESDTEKIKSLFQGKWCRLDNPSCGFTEKVSIKLGNETFMPACDGCSIVKCGYKYFLLSEEEREQLDEILSNYGVSFPCV